MSPLEALLVVFAQEAETMVVPAIKTLGCKELPPMIARLQATHDSIHANLIKFGKELEKTGLELAIEILTLALGACECPAPNAATPTSTQG